MPWVLHTTGAFAPLQWPKYHHPKRSEQLVDHELQCSSSKVQIATTRSTELLRTLPMSLLLMILSHLVDEILQGYTVTGAFYKFVDLSNIVFYTMALRNVCSTWAQAVRILVLGGKGSRQGRLCLIKHTFLSDLRKTFPRLRDCVVNLGDPNNIERLELIRSAFSTCEGQGHSLDFITAISWDDEPRDWNRGYERYGHVIKWRESCDKQCKSRGIPFWVSDEASDESRGNWSHPDIPVVNPDIFSLIFHQTLSLSYFHSQLFREILHHIPAVEYLDMPTFMLPGLLVDPLEYTLQENPSPRALRKIGIEFENYGRSFHSVLNTVRCMHVVSFPNPLYSEFLHYNDVMSSPEENTSQSDLRFRMERKLRRHFLKLFEKLPMRMKESMSITGLGYRGSEFDSVERLEPWLEVLKALQRQQRLVQHVHIVEGFYLEYQPIMPSSLGLLAPRPLTPDSYCLRHLVYSASI